MNQSTKKLVVDTNTFITTPMELANMASLYTMITTPSVLAEIKDAETKNKVQTFFPTLIVTAPSTKGRTFVIDFAKRTGDFVSLSQTDIDVIALAYDLIESEGKAQQLRSEPKASTNQTGGAKEEGKKKNNNMGWGEAGWASDDEDGWVGPSNIDSMKTETKPDVIGEDAALQINASVITSDFAMQNILLQIGIPLLNIEGKIITKVKSFVLECFSCWAVSRKTDIVFCKKCGKDTLLKVTCEFLDDGSFLMYRKKNKDIIKRGARYPIPEPKGGRQLNDMILYEDDLLKPKVQSYLRRLEKNTEKQEQTLAYNFESGIGLDGVKSQRKQLKSLNFGLNRRNPNVAKKK